MKGRLLYCSPYPHPPAHRGMLGTQQFLNNICERRRKKRKREKGWEKGREGARNMLGVRLARQNF